MASNESGDKPQTVDKAQEHFEDLISRYEKEFAPWHEAARKVLKIYSQPVKSSKRKMSMLWANVNVLQPAIYSRLPLPSVFRRFLDSDPVANKASELIERCLSYQFDMGGVDAILRQVRDDFIIVGRGTAWARYAVDLEPQTDTNGEPAMGDDGEPAEQIKDERVAWEYVIHSDFGHNVARTWAEVTDVWRKVYLNRAELKARFGGSLSPEEIASIPLNFRPARKEEQTAGNKQAVVYEIWSKSDRKVYWIVKGFPKPLDVSDPPLNLHGFFPCPKPVYTTTEPMSLVPVPDYRMYQDQAEEVDELTGRIASLTDALKLVGFYPAEVDGSSQSAIEKAARPETQNVLIAVSNWAMLSEKSGGNAITWWPAQDVSRVIENCIGVRKALIDDIYQLTGISDIVRGQGQASETATQSNIKSQWGTMRIRDRQNELARFARDLARIGGEILAEHFQADRLNAMSNLNLPTADELAAAALANGMESPPANAMSIDAVVELLRNDRLRSYRIDVETDQMVEADQQAEKRDRIELMGALGNIVQQAAPLLMSPVGGAIAPVIAEVGMFTLRGFKAGRAVEDSITKAFGGLMEQLNKPPEQPKSDPVAMARAEAQVAKASVDKLRLDAETQEKAGRLNLDTQKHMDQTAIKSRELQIKEAEQQFEELKAFLGR